MSSSGNLCGNMDFIKLMELQIDGNELSRNKEELDKFIGKYSKNHMELKFMVNGYRLISKSEKKIELPPIIITEVFPFKSKDEKFEIAYKKSEIFEATLAYVFQTPKNHTIRVSAGNGTIFPISRNYANNFYVNNIFMVDDVEKDWNSKKEVLVKYLDYFLKNEIDVLPILWYGKGLVSNDKTSSFLNFYRCIEVLSKLHYIKIKSEIRQIIEEPLNIMDKKTEIQSIYGMVGIPERMVIPFFLEEQGIQKQTYEKWRKFRNKMTHGELTLELNDEFRHEFSNLHNTAKTTLNEWITNYFK